MILSYGATEVLHGGGGTWAGVWHGITGLIKVIKARAVKLVGIRSARKTFRPSELS